MFISNGMFWKQAKELTDDQIDELYDKIFRIFKETDWIKVYDMTSTPNLLRWQIVKYLKEQIPELE